MSEFELRRSKLFSKLQDNSCAVIFSGVSKNSNSDATLPFVVNKNFYYLTGITQEASVLLLVKSFGEEKAYLFIEPHDPVKEKWFGKRLTNEEAIAISDIKNINSTQVLDSILSLVLTKEGSEYGSISSLYLDLTPEIKIGEGKYTTDLAQIMKEKYPEVEVLDIFNILTELRMVKSNFEVEEIKKAINLTEKGLNQMILNMQVGKYEYALADIFEFYGRSHDRAGLAFPTIIASGKNATILHYPTQNERIGENELVLFDLGYDHNLYCADISRTYPVSGKYEGKGRLIYEAVLNCNKALIEYAKAGLKLIDLQNFAVEFLTNECLRLRLITNKEDIRKYYYHSCSHHLGLDTHDIAIREKPLEPGNIITIEPGLYFAEYNVGVRIEDDVLITEGKAINLSSNIIKEIEDIERVFAMKK